MQNSLLISLLAGNGGRRLVRSALARQPTSPPCFAESDGPRTAPLFFVRVLGAFAGLKCNDVSSETHTARLCGRARAQYLHRAVRGLAPGRDNHRSLRAVRGWRFDAKRTASGERFNANGNTAAARTWPMGTTLTVTNPGNGRSVLVRINDKGPWGTAYRVGARLDLARGAAQRIGMYGSQYVCVT